MSWYRKNADDLEFLEEIERQVIERGVGDIPQVLLDQPVMPAEIMPMARAFTTLDRTRQPGFNGPAPIQLQEIKAYLFFYPQFDPIFFAELMLHVDSLFIRAFIDDGKRTKSKT